MATTVQQLINASLESIGRSWPGYTPSSADSDACLIYLNRVVDSFNTQRSYVCGLDTVTVAVTSGTRLYALSTRPIHIERAEFHVSVAGVTFPHFVPVLGFADFNAIANPGELTPFPEGLYCDYGVTTASVILAPIPQSGSLKLYTWQVIAQFAALSDTVTVPPGILRALQYALAVEICPSFRVAVTTELAGLANSTKAAMESLNLTHVYGVPTAGAAK